MKCVLMALAITIMLCPSAAPASDEARTTDAPDVVGVVADPVNPCGEAAPPDTLAREPDGRYEGPNSSEFPDPDPPCPPGG